MILLIDNYDSFTWNLVQRLGELDGSLEPGRDLVVARNDKITPESAATLDQGQGPSHVIISPGPCTPNESGVSRDVIEQFAGRVPILGVCLGHQCIADRFGMRVVRHPILMHGKTSLVHHDGRGVFEGVPTPFTATRYHSLVVTPESIPPVKDGEDGWEVSATSTEPNGQMVVMGLRRVWAEPTWDDGSPKQVVEGVQFHPESFLTDEGPRLLWNFLRMGPRGRTVPAPEPAIPAASGIQPTTLPPCFTRPPFRSSLLTSPAARSMRSSRRRPPRRPTSCSPCRTPAIGCTSSPWAASPTRCASGSASG